MIVSNCWCNDKNANRNVMQLDIDTVSSNLGTSSTETPLFGNASRIQGIIFTVFVVILYFLVQSSRKDT